jgi:hypothetical protein
MTDAKQIARSLSKAQRAYMTTKAVWQQPETWAESRWMTFPPPNTHRVLSQMGLVTITGCLSTLAYQ